MEIKTRQILTIGSFLLLAGLVFISVESARSVPAAIRAAATALVIDGAQVWDGTGRPPVQDAVMVIRGDLIEAVGPRKSVTVPKDAVTIPGHGKTVIPGLI